MISYYELTKELKETGIDELEQSLFQKSSEYLQKKSEEMKKEMFGELSFDIEKWISERVDNVKRYFFDAIINHIFAVQYIHVDHEDRETINKFLSEIGYTAESLRRKIYEENKETILEALLQDAFYERIKPFGRYFKSWDFADITQAYPQSLIIKGFLEEVMTKKGFNDYVKDMLSADINDLRKERNDLLDSLNKIKSEIESLTE